MRPWKDPSSPSIPNWAIDLQLLAPKKSRGPVNHASTITIIGGEFSSSGKTFSAVNQPTKQLEMGLCRSKEREVRKLENPS